MEEKNTPKLRFSGFDQDWEQRKLGEISNKVKDKNKSRRYTETLTNSAEFGIINQREFFEKDISNTKNLDGYYLVQNDDFVYNPRISNFAPVGPIKRNKLGRTGVMSPLYYVFRTHNIDQEYLETYFNTKYWHRFMELNGDSGARSDRFAIKDSVFVNMPIPYPSVGEQQKIGNFFKQLDDTIALHQRKLEQLKLLKQAFLQKMFVNQGNVPELRFADFDEEWEERKLGEILKVNSGRDYKHLNDGVVPVYGTGGYMLSVDDKLSDIDAIGIGRKGTIDKPQYLKSPFWTVDTLFFLTPLYDDRLNFILQFAYKITWKKYAEQTSVPSLSKASIESIEIKVPDTREQEKIGAFFKQLDNTIAFHQKKLTNLKQLKKAFLQFMFI